MDTAVVDARLAEDPALDGGSPTYQEWAHGRSVRQL
jgi:hypothetical protein